MPPKSTPPEWFAPPPGPPPGWKGTGSPPQAGEEYAPPPGPPPNMKPPQHDWQALVPDTSLFPPPPAIFSAFDRSPANNATADEAAAGEAWCARYPLALPAPLAPSPAALPSLVPPAGFSGRVAALAPGRWALQTPPGSPDRCILAFPPLYSARAHAGRRRTIYYEVRVRAGATANVALGFAALPYPGFRLPGWHRGSLAVHGDDGHRYVNDCWGGRAFVAGFRPGGTYGIGMVLAPGGRAEVFFTRDGVREGGWNVHEERDAETDRGVEGLEGHHDLSCAIGCFEDVDVEVVFEPGGWMYAVEM